MSVHIDGSLQSPTITWGNAYQLAADGTAYLHLGGLTSFDSLQILGQSDGVFVGGKNAIN